MELETIGASGVLDKAFEMVRSELPPTSPEEEARLAVEVYKAWLQADGLSRIASAISGLTSTLETFGSRNSG